MKTSFNYGYQIGSQAQPIICVDFVRVNADYEDFSDSTILFDALGLAWTPERLLDVTKSSCAYSLSCGREGAY